MQSSSLRTDGRSTPLTPGGESTDDAIISAYRIQAQNAVGFLTIGPLISHTIASYYGNHTLCAPRDASHATTDNLQLQRSSVFSAEAGRHLAIALAFRDLVGPYTEPTRHTWARMCTGKKSSSEGMRISAHQFDRFYARFESMCNVIRDFHHIYSRDNSLLDCFFYDEEQATQKLSAQRTGTFLLSGCSKQHNKLLIFYKSSNGQVKRRQFTRVRPEIYTMDSRHQQTMSVFTIIRSLAKLKYMFFTDKAVVPKSHYF